MVDARGAESPFFVVGAQRSGTTMLRLMLNAHSRLAVPFETDFLRFYRRREEFGALDRPGALDRFLDALEADQWFRRAGLVRDRAAIAALGPRSVVDAIDAVFGVHARAEGKVRWGDKSPAAVTHVDELWECFPDAPVVHIVRDGRDVAVSMRGLSWGSGHLPNVARDWRWKTVLAHRIGRMRRDRYLLVHYERLVSDPAGELEAICRFLGEEYESGMLAYSRDAASRMPKESLAWHGASVRPPDPKKAFAWKRAMSLADQIIFDDIAGDALELFGYERVRHPPTLSSRLKFIHYHVLKRW